MPIRSLGKLVNTGSAPKRLTAGETDPTKAILCHAVIVSQILGQSGAIYIGTSDMVISTLVGVVYVLPPPTANILPSWRHVFENEQAGCDPSQLYFLQATDTQGVTVGLEIP